MTGMNENTIKVKLFRARQKLLRPLRGSRAQRGWRLLNFGASESYTMYLRASGRQIRETGTVQSMSY